MLERELSCSGICNPYSLYLFTDVSQGLPRRTCAQGMIHLLERVSELAMIQALVITLMSILNAIAVWILNSRYILLVNDDDLYGEESAYDFDENFNNSSYSKNTSTQMASDLNDIPLVGSKKLNLEINRTIKERRMKMIEKMSTLPMPEIQEKRRESENLTNLISQLPLMYRHRTNINGPADD